MDVPRQRRSLTPDDWIGTALKGLVEEGPSAVRAACVARKLGVTSSSFYWHFKNREAFRDRILDSWRKLVVARAANMAERAGAGREQIRSLPSMVAAVQGPDVDDAMRRWAAMDEAVARAVAEADAFRLRRMTGMLREAGFDESAAESRARMLAWAFRGSSGAEPEVRQRTLGDLLKTILAGLPDQRDAKGR